MKFSWHRLIPFLPFLRLPIRRLGSTTLGYCYIFRCTPSASTTPVLPNTSYNLFARNSRKTRGTCQNAWRGPHRKHSFLYYCKDMFTAPLPSNRGIRCRGNIFSDPLLSNRCPIVACTMLRECVY
jgi:hypothetical protein